MTVDLGKLREGTLRDLSFAHLLWALARDERTVVLELRRNQLEKRVVLEDGVPVDCRSNLLHETLGKFLVTRGRLAEDAYQKCLAESAKSSSSLADVLLRAELLSAFELFKVLQQNLAYKLLDAFTWREGTFRLHAEVPAVDSALKVRVPQLVLTGITRYAPQPVVDEGVAGLVGRPLALHPSPAVTLGSLRLSPRHARVAQLLRAPQRLDQLMADSRLPPDELTRLLHALHVLGIVLPEDELPAAAPPLTAAPPAPVVDLTPPAEPAPSPEPMPQAEMERLRNDVTRAYLNHRRQDAFDLLGVAHDATPARIREHWLSFARKYAPWEFEHPSLAALQDKAQDLFVAGARAFATLMDPEARNSLAWKRMQARDDSPRAAGNAFAIRTEILDADAQHHKGAAHLAAARFSEALPLLEFAADCDPQNAAFQADLAWCRFRLRPAQPDEPRAALTDVLRMDPECGVAHYYAGEIARLRGDRTAADGHLRKAAKLMQGDRRPTEALKQLLTEK
ncbi:MAG: DUF4388 domain-containing protein [Deltaproteobacteria bacterium]|nr:DUF4388 domain-containing protein [Deltaproteobacteria bacterium]